MNDTVIGILGLNGSGKTCMAVRYAILEKELHPYKKIYSNVHLNNYDYEPLDLVDLFLNHPNEKGLIILGDEISTFMDCRVSGSGRNRVESYFLKQKRKRDSLIIFTDQFERYVDLRLSEFCDIRIVMENRECIYKFTFKGIPYRIKKPHPFLFRATYYTHETIKDRIFDGRKWFNEYDTGQEIYPPEDYIPKKLLDKYRKNNV